MTRDETLALFAQGKEAWNAWAEMMLAERERLVEAGEWEVDVRVLGLVELKNEVTRAWSVMAAANFSTEEKPHTFERAVDFTGFLFPGDVWFDKATFSGEAGFGKATFSGSVGLVGATFSMGARFDSAKFERVAGFLGTTFTRHALFDGVAFKAGAWFDNAVFAGGAWFGYSTFASVAGFDCATFSAMAEFCSAEFSGRANFNMVTFSGGAGFKEATFKEPAGFSTAIFNGDAEFDNATFADDAGFHDAVFEGDVKFAGAKFKGNIEFYKATFKDLAGFGGVTFEQDARFDGATFSGLAGFGRVTFKGGAGFDGATFEGDAGFAQTVFEGFASFERATFAKEASFVAMHGKERSTFSLREVTFAAVPDFEQAHFAEAPQLDDSRIRVHRWASWRARPTLPLRLPPFKNADRTAPGGVEKAVEARPNLTARWRALKRLAVQGLDHEREQTYFAEEIKSLRGSTDFALPRPLNLLRKGEALWPGGARYWMGLLYQAFSDFGRSMVRPLAWWALLTLLFTLVYLGQHFSRREPAYSYSMLDWVILKSVGSGPTLSCRTGSASDPLASALYLSVHKGSLIAGLGGSDKLSQAYACLYGEDASFGDLAKQQLIPVIPDAVVFWSLGQTILSAALIFLFLLAVRGHFRIK